MLLMLPPAYMADHPSILSLRRLPHFSRYYIFPLRFDGIMRPLAIKFPICMRKVIATMRKVANITILDTGCLMSIFYCFLFGQKSIYLVGGHGGKIFRLRTLPPMPPDFVAGAVFFLLQIAGYSD